MPEFRDILHDRIVPNRREIVPLLETCLWNSQDVYAVESQSDRPGGVPNKKKAPARSWG